MHADNLMLNRLGRFGRLIHVGEYSGTMVIAKALLASKEALAFLLFLLVLLASENLSTHVADCFLYHSLI